MRTFPSFRVSRSRLATAVVGFGVAATIACGDASPQMEDAATMLDDAATILRDMQTDANAQPVPLEPMVLDCDLSYQLVQTTNPGEVNQFVSTRSGAYDQVVVEDPTRWVVALWAHAGDHWQYCRTVWRRERDLHGLVGADTRLRTQPPELHRHHDPSDVRHCFAWADRRQRYDDDSHLSVGAARAALRARQRQPERATTEFG